MKKQNYYLSLLLLMVISLSFGQIQKASTFQVGSTSTSSQDASAAVQIDSQDKGFLPPRMTTEQRNAIQNPVAGLTIFNTTKNCLESYNGSGWFNFCNNNDISLTTRGTAVVASWDCNNGTSVGTLTYGQLVTTAVTQTVKANVLSKGSYDIQAQKAGVTFSAKGYFNAIGVQNVLLTATGTPIQSGSSIEFDLNTNPNCKFTRGITGFRPSSPTNAVGTTVKNTATISFTASANHGGDANIVYKVVDASNPTTVLASSTQSPITVTGLTYDTAYTFNLIASNSNGDSDSVVLDPLTPVQTVPSTPTITSVTQTSPTTARVVLNVADNGGAAITSYKVTVTPVNLVVTATTPTVDITGLTWDTDYTFVATATNLKGQSGTSANATLKLTRLGAVFTDHFNGVVNEVYSGTNTNTTIKHNQGEAFSSLTLCNDQVMSVQKSAADCPNSVLSFDGARSYSTTLINGQCWLAENLKDLPTNPATRPTVTTIANLATDVGWAGPYNFDNANVNNHGLLYQSSAARNNSTAAVPQGVCPQGWHLPTVCDFRYLVWGLGARIDNTGVISGVNNSNLINKLLINNTAPNLEVGNNASGFSALFGGRFGAPTTGGTTSFLEGPTAQNAYKGSRVIFRGNGAGVGLYLLRNNNNIISAVSGNLMAANFAGYVRCIKD